MLFSNDDGEKRWVEQLICNEFQNSMEISENTKLANINFPLNDPPDFTFQSKNKRLTGEATELTNSDFHKEFSRSKKCEHPYSAHFGKGFMDTQWTETLFEKCLAECIERKDIKYQKRSLVFDILLVYSGEQWLLPCDVSQWIEQTNFCTPKSFKSVYLLLNYDPSWSQSHWPVFHISGEKLT